MGVLHEDLRMCGYPRRHHRLHRDIAACAKLHAPGWLPARRDRDDPRARGRAIDGDVGLSVPVVVPHDRQVARLAAKGVGRERRVVRPRLENEPVACGRPVDHEVRAGVLVVIFAWVRLPRPNRPEELPAEIELVPVPPQDPVLLDEGAQQPPAPVMGREDRLAGAVFTVRSRSPSKSGAGTATSAGVTHRLREGCQRS